MWVREYDAITPVAECLAFESDPCLPRATHLRWWVRPSLCRSSSATRSCAKTNWIASRKLAPWARFRGLLLDYPHLTLPPLHPWRCLTHSASPSSLLALFNPRQPHSASPPHSASINPDLASLNLFPLYSLILPLTLPRPIWQTTSNHMQHVLDILVFKTSTQKQNVREIHKILGILKARIPHAIWMSTSSLNLLRLTWSTRRWRKGKFLLSSGRKTKRLTPSCRGGSKESFVSLWLVVVIRSC